MLHCREGQSDGAQCLESGKSHVELKPLLIPTNTHSWPFLSDRTLANSCIMIRMFVSRSHSSKAAIITGYSKDVSLPSCFESG